MWKKALGLAFLVGLATVMAYLVLPWLLYPAIVPEPIDVTGASILLVFVAAFVPSLFGNYVLLNEDKRVED